jgi:hypothetical protein
LQLVICSGYPISKDRLNSRSVECHYSLCTRIWYCLMRVMPNWLTIHVLSWLNTYTLRRRLSTCILTRWLAINNSTWFTLLKMFVHTWAKDTHHHLSEAIQKCSVVSSHYFFHSSLYLKDRYGKPERGGVNGWGPCVVRGPVDGRFLVWWVIDNVVWTDSWLSIAGAGCGMTRVGAGEEHVGNMT